jgi:hypothetical protein
VLFTRKRRLSFDQTRCAVTLPNEQFEIKHSALRAFRDQSRSDVMRLTKGDAAGETPTRRVGIMSNHHAFIGAR